MRFVKHLTNVGDEGRPAMDTDKSRVVEQIRELNMLVLHSKTQVVRAHLEQACEAVPTRACRADAREEEGGPAERDAHEAVHGNGANDLSTFHGQGRLLSLLGLKPVISQKDLSYVLGMSRQAVGELLSKLEAKGLIEREPSGQDRRTMTVSLTEEGKRVAMSVHEQAEAGTDMLDCLTEDELAQFSEYLQRIINAAEAAAPDDEFTERRRAMREFMALSRMPHEGGFADEEIDRIER